MAAGNTSYLFVSGTETVAFEVDTPGIPIPNGVSYAWDIGAWSDNDGSSTASPTINQINSSATSISGEFVNAPRCIVSMTGLGSKTSAPASLSLLIQLTGRPRRQQGAAYTGGPSARITITAAKTICQLAPDIVEWKDSTAHRGMLHERSFPGL